MNPLLSTQDERAVAAIALLLETHVGYSVDFSGMLVVTDLEDGRSSVTTLLTNLAVHSRDPKQTTEAQWLFTQAREAAECFLQKRAELRLGHDFERDTEAQRAHGPAGIRSGRSRPSARQTG